MTKMNNLIELKGTFLHNENPNKPKGVSLPTNADIEPVLVEQDC